MPSYLPAHREFENLCFISVAPVVCMSHVFVYDAVNVSKMVVISSTKSPSGPYATLADLLIHGEHFKPNCNIID